MQVSDDRSSLGNIEFLGIGLVCFLPSLHSSCKHVSLVLIFFLSDFVSCFMFIGSYLSSVTVSLASFTLK